MKGGRPLIPKNLVKNETVFLKLDFDWRAPYSPMKRSAGPKPIVLAVSRLEASLVITSTPPLLATAITDLKLPRSIPIDTT